MRKVDNVKYIFYQRKVFMGIKNTYIRINLKGINDIIHSVTKKLMNPEEIETKSQNLPGV